MLPRDLAFKTPTVVRYYCGSANLHHKHMANPVSWGKYKNLTSQALDAIQRDPVTGTRAMELRTLRNSQSLDFLALDEVLESRRQWATQKWGDFEDPWRKYSNVPLGCAPVRRFEEQLEVESKILGLN